MAITAPYGRGLTRTGPLREVVLRCSDRQRPKRIPSRTALNIASGGHEDYYVASETGVHPGACPFKCDTEGGFCFD